MYMQVYRVYMFPYIWYESPKKDIGTLSWIVTILILMGCEENLYEKLCDFYFVFAPHMKLEQFLFDSNKEINCPWNCLILIKCKYNGI